MRYYCKNCKSEVKTHFICHFEGGCAFCNGLMESIPEFETPAQYKERTGEVWRGGVWFRDNGPFGSKKWELQMRNKLSMKNQGCDYLCANGPNPPPDDWMSEEEDD